MCNNKMDNAKKQDNCCNFDHHGDVLVQSRVHCPMKHIKGFARSHWMPPSSECLHRIALAAATVAILV
jgi:hypothetical protein